MRRRQWKKNTKREREHVHPYGVDRATGLIVAFDGVNRIFHVAGEPLPRKPSDLRPVSPADILTHGVFRLALPRTRS